MSDSMDGQSLNRKWHTLNGWQVERASDRIGRWHHLVRPDGSRRYSAIEPDVCWRYLPKLDQDANLAIAEADRVFAGSWNACRDDAKVIFNGFRNEPGFGYVGEATGQHAFCEAILKALIASKERSE